jgi:hypothetical protein
MKTPLFPAEGYGFKWLTQNPIKRDYAGDAALGGFILTIVVAIVGLGAVAYDQVRDAHWDAERVTICDTRGC